MDFFDRDSQLSLLKISLADVRAGMGRVALVSGEAGIGKTTLLKQFISQQGPTTRSFWGTCDALFTPRPLGPLHDMAPKIGGKLPELLLSDAPRNFVFSTMLAELQRCPTIIVFEDVHWADEATFDLLHFIGRRIAETSALLVISYRDDELGTQHPLRGLLGDLAPLSLTRRIPIPPLSEGAVQALVGDQEFDAAALYRQTGGNPFYVTEVLANPGSGIPANVREATLARAVRLSPSAYAVLEAAAVIGQRVEPWLLAAVTGAEVQAAEECMARGMLLAQEDDLAFRHELVRKTILGEISPLRKQVLHRMVFDALKSSPAKRQDLARLTHHAETAQDHEAVLEFAPIAAKQASAAGAHREAARLYSLALRFAVTVPPDERAFLLAAYADECNLIDQRVEALEARQEALALWRELDNPLKQGDSLSHITFLLNGLGKIAEAEQTCLQAIELLEARPPSHELAYAYRVRSGLHMLNHNYHQAIEWGEKAIALAERFQDQQLVLETSVPIGTAWLSIDYEYGCKYMENILVAACQAGLETVAAHAYTNLSSLSSELYQFEKAERYTAEGMAYAVEHGQERFRLYMLAWQAMTHVRRGNWEEAVDLATLILKRPGVSVTTRITALAALGYVFSRRGDPKALPMLDEALDLSGGTGSLHRIALVRAARAETAWLAGDLERTFEEAHAAYDLALNKQHPWFTGELAFWCWRAGNEILLFDWVAPPYALQIAGRWQAAADAWARMGCPYERARALADGDQQAQISALEIFEQLQARPDADLLRAKLRATGISGIPRQPHPSTRENPFGITNRQLGILALLVEGLSNAEIAARLHISPKTVDHHVSAVLTRLDLHTREDAAALALAHPYFHKK